jgi:hypothetical protein
MQRCKVYSFCSRCKLLLAAIVWMTKTSGTAGQVVVVCNGGERPDACRRFLFDHLLVASSRPRRCRAGFLCASAHAAVAIASVQLRPLG